MLNLVILSLFGLDRHGSEVGPALLSMCGEHAIEQTIKQSVLVRPL